MQNFDGRAVLRDLEMAISRLPEQQLKTFTVNSAHYAELLSNEHLTPEQQNFGRVRTADYLIHVAEQTTGIIGWSDGSRLAEYLEMMGERPTKQPERLAALREMETYSSVPFDDLVRSSFLITTEDLHKILMFCASRVAVMREPVIAQGFADAVKKAFGEFQPTKKRKRISRQPFYSKFARKRR